MEQENGHFQNGPKSTKTMDYSPWFGVSFGHLGKCLFYAGICLKHLLISFRVNKNVFVVNWSKKMDTFKMV